MVCMQALPPIDRLHPPRPPSLNALSVDVRDVERLSPALSHACAHGGPYGGTDVAGDASASSVAQLQASNVSVSTKEELYEALKSGVENIVLRQHVDLSMEGPAGLSIIADTLQSLRVRRLLVPSACFFTLAFQRRSL